MSGIDIDADGATTTGVQKPVDSKQEEPWTLDNALSHAQQTFPTNLPTPIPFFHLLERLKTTKREGWRRFGIDSGESISDHMYRMALITMLAPPSLSSRLNVLHCTKMALIHDIAESLVGDITPADGVPKSEKSRREATTIDYICSDLLGGVHGGLAGEDIRRIWDEYEKGETLESQFVHDVDKIELTLQMVEYERSHKGKIDLSEFTRVQRRIVLPEIRLWAEELLSERAQLWKDLGKVPDGSLLTANHAKNVNEYYSTS